MAGGTVIKLHTCANAGQDKLYGKGMRVMNETKDPAKVRCTVCGQVVSA